MRINKQNGISAILVLVFVIVIFFAAGYFLPEKYLNPVIQKFSNITSIAIGSGKVSGLDFPWPPELDQPFPDIKLYSHTGEMVQLSDFKGKVILLEPIGMTCPACNAFSGAILKGGYQGVSAQQNLPPIESLLPQYANGIELDDDRLVLVQLMLYDLQYKAPTIENSRLWAEHFDLDNRANVTLLVGDERYINQASYDMIPGFFLIDKDFILRSDSTGHRPKHNLYTQLLPKVSVLLQSVNLEQPVNTNESNNFSITEQFPEKLYAQLGMSVPVARAYRSIPHKQTTFNPASAKMNPQEIEYLYKLFSIVDIAIVQRVQTLLWYQTGGRRGEDNTNYQQILLELEKLDVSDHLKPAHQLIQQSIQEQHQYFEEIDIAEKYSLNTRNKLIQASHAKLIKAYTLLMALFPQENNHNKTAFYDHLCALDFI